MSTLVQYSLNICITYIYKLHNTCISINWVNNPKGISQLAQDLIYICNIIH